MVCPVQLFRGCGRNVDRLVRADGRLEVPGACPSLPSYVYRTSYCHCPRKCSGKNTCDEAGGSMDQSRCSLRHLVRSRARLEGHRPRVVQGCCRTHHSTVDRRPTYLFFFFQQVLTVTVPSTKKSHFDRDSYLPPVRTFHLGPFGARCIDNLDI